MQACSGNVRPNTGRLPRLPETMINHRQGIRRRTLALVKVHGRHGQNAGIMYDIGPDGMRVLSNVVPQLNDRVDICISMPGSSLAPVLIPGLVIHHGRYDFGLLFRELDSAARALVKKIYRARQPA